MPNHFWRAAAAAALLMSLPVAVSAQQPQMQMQPQMQAPAATYSDSQLHDFAGASVELDQLKRGLGDNPSTDEQQRAATEAQAVLQRHNMDAATYNAIASRANADEALAQRIMRMRENANH